MPKRTRDVETNKIQEAERLYELAKNLSEKGLHKEALRVFKKSIETHDLTNHSQRFCMLGDMQINAGLIDDNRVLFEQALGSFNRHLQYKPTSTRAYEGLVQAYEHLDNIQSAKKALFQAIKYGSKFDFIDEWIKVLDCKDFVFTEAERFISQAKEVQDMYSEKDFKYIAYLHRFLIHLGNESADSYASYAFSLLRAGSLNSMKIAFEKSISLDPENITRHLDLAKALSMKEGNEGRISTALYKAVSLAKTSKEIEKIIADYIEKDPKKFGLLENTVYTKQGVIELENKNFDAALEALNKAIACSEGNYETYEKLGEVQCSLGNFKDSVEAFDQALWLNPANLQAKLNSAGVLGNLGKIDEAFERLEEVKSHPLFAGNASYEEFAVKVTEFLSTLRQEQANARSTPYELLTEFSAAAPVADTANLHEDDGYSLAGELIDEWFKESEMAPYI